MRHQTRIAAAAFILCIGSSGLALAAETGGAPSEGKNGVAGFPTAKDTASTSSAHNTESSSNATGMENRGSAEMGTDTSTHNPTGKKD
jgi:hypothetical protein